MRGSLLRIWDDGRVRLPPFRIERWYERFEFTTELMLSSSDCETVTVRELLDLEPGATERLDGLRLGYTEVPGSEELRAAIAGLYPETGPEAVVAFARAHPELRHRALAWTMVDLEVACLAPATVYRLLREAGLIARWPRPATRRSRRPQKLSSRDVGHRGRSLNRSLRLPIRLSMAPTERRGSRGERAGQAQLHG